MFDIKSLAKMLGVPQPELLALAAANDPFALHLPARRCAAEWFAVLWERFRFGAGTHIRRIHYRIISASEPILRPDGEPYANTQRCWQLLVNASRDARYLRLVPEGAFVDRRSPEPLEWFTLRKQGWAYVSGDDLAYSTIGEDDFPELPHLHFTGEEYGPPVLVEIWCEKTSMNDVLLPPAQQYGANLITGAGEMSLTAVRLFLERARLAGKPTRILYVSDFDPAGRSMPVGVARKIEFAIDGATDLDIKLDPIVLTEEQCGLYRLPRTPIKETEARGARFEERFGAGATELDALEALHPGELDRIVGLEIERYIDPDAKRDFALAADEHRRYLHRISTRVQAAFLDAVEDLRGEYEAIVASLEGWQERAAPVFDGIKRAFDHTSINHFTAPPSKKPDDPDDPLFDSRRSYLDQIAHYHAWQRG